MDALFVPHQCEQAAQFLMQRGNDAYGASLTGCGIHMCSLTDSSAKKGFVGQKSLRFGRLFALPGVIAVNGGALAIALCRHMRV
jgi:hypothetical protein